jgi:hypothetical protein
VCMIGQRHRGISFALVVCITPYFPSAVCLMSPVWQVDLWLGL